jgi:hypothetical protein
MRGRTNQPGKSGELKTRGGFVFYEQVIPRYIERIGFLHPHPP